MAFNQDELVAPAWMDEQFFTKVLHISQNNKMLKVSNSAFWLCNDQSEIR
jgi:hypothetical protein